MRKRNASSAVMQQRSEPHDSLDDFPTPPWATRALMEHIVGDVENLVAYDPAANRGYMVRPLEEYFPKVIASDIHDYGMGYEVQDFLFPWEMQQVDWVITNPPFRLAEQFIERALEVAKQGVAVIVRSAFLEGKGRYFRLFREYPPSIVGQFVERVPMVKGRYDPKISSATAYSWLVWQKPLIREGENPEFRWIPPCREQLEKSSDEM